MSHADAAGLRDHLDRLLGIAAHLVREAQPERVHLVAAVRQQSPVDRVAVGRSDGPVALVAAEIGHRRAERGAPPDRVALIADVPPELRVRDLGDVLADHVLVAAEAAAGEDQRVATYGLLRAVGTGEADGDHAAVVSRVEVSRKRARHDVDTERRRGRKQRALELLAGAMRRAVHTEHGVTGIQEPFDELERDAVPVGEPLDRRSRRARDRIDDRAVGRALRLAPDVRGEELRRVLDAERALEARARRRNEPGRERRAAGGLRVAFEDQRFRAGLARGQRRGQAARAGTDDDDRDRVLEPRFSRREHRHLSEPRCRRRRSADCRARA